jgi:GNAT superfamily N-acetyltransferase
MNKKLLLTLIALNTTQLLCSETALHSHPAKVSPEGAQAGSASLYTAGTSSVKHFSYTIQPSNQITEEEAYKHQDLINAAFKPTSLEIKKPYTFLYELNKKRDVIVSAYETDAKTHQRVLVGGLFGTKYRNSAGCSEPPGFVKTETAINSIYVSDRVQRQGIGTQMVKLLKEYAKNLPIALYKNYQHTWKSILG